MQSKCHEEQEFILVNKAGIHVEPADKFVNVTQKYKSEIQVQAKGKLVDAKSILNVMALGLRCGDHFHVKIDGEDAKEAMKGIVAIIERINSGEFSKMPWDPGYQPRRIYSEPAGFLTKLCNFIRRM